MNKNELNVRKKECPIPLMNGFYLSNTQLRKVLQAHRNYGYNIKYMDGNFPSLNIYTGDLFTAKEKGTLENQD
ncbi:MAG: hypothetical protein ACTHKK_04315 [Candidatus Nitrosocosmicus sp.]